MKYLKKLPVWVSQIKPHFLIGALVAVILAMPAFAREQNQLNQTRHFNLVLDTNSFEVVKIKSESVKIVRTEPLQPVLIAITPPIFANDIGLEQKREKVKEAAGKYNVDWKILEAVWQVETGKSWDTATRSYAGATGPLQFMPGTFRKYGEDANGDGKASIYDAEDSLAAAAKLLAANGAADGQIDQSLFAYNHSKTYVAKVKRVANSIVE
ncbi:lytic transglycosylase domain-containing protein [Candidatus Berkelbacteria bacterium]|nr:lytic transglycosylase domain-containing protein [Candidatus Berkelbacteria bacterium]MBI2588453.1 lytic transglycosylase domain-containing protein [Candidatus Berkelbacteria bacterium]MBI4029576.1 lytic transglycosylase domain-containing protein [Candidatus Berkelbacteria bacterium]